MGNNTTFDRRRNEITRAFVDRRPIDWVALLDRAAGPGDRAALDALRRLDALRGRSSTPEPEPAHVWTTVLHIMVVVAAAQVLIGLQHLAVAAVNGAASVDLAPRALLAGVLAAASLLLASAVQRDHRVFFLLAAFMLTASAFARSLEHAIPHGGSMTGVMFHGLYPEAFAPAALWQFVAVFPAVRRFTTFDVMARRAASAAGALGAGLFLTNLLMAQGWLTEPLAVLARDHPGRLFWQLFAGATFPALAAIVVRAHRAPWSERIKVVRFGWAIGAGAAPILVIGVAETLPGIASLMVTTGIRPWVDVVVISALMAMPMLATFGVLVDGPFGPRREADRARTIGSRAPPADSTPCARE